MARPSKSAAVMVKNLTKEEKQARLEGEQRLKGNADNISPPRYLNKKQKSIFRYIVKNLEASGILGNLDIYVLTTCCIAIDRLQEIETLINEDFSKLYDKDLLSAKDKYTKDLYRCCNELSLSPQSRAKLANINVQAKEEEQDPLLGLLREVK